MMENYEHPAEPLFQGTYAPPLPAAPRTPIKLATWNIKFSEKIDEAVATLESAPDLVGIDILLLQEMDEQGTDAIAQALKLNYVYFPASVHSRHGRNFGNAILSPWPITYPEKLILPHANPRNGQRRIATRAIVNIGPRAILAYSVHFETFWLGPKRRTGQVEAVVDTVAHHYDYVVIGGDFNTLTPSSVSSLTTRMEQHALVWLTSDVGHTAKAGALPMQLDHIFGSDVPVLDKGVWRDTSASDHYPVWVALDQPGK